MLFCGGAGVNCKVLYSVVVLLLGFCTNTSAEIIVEQLNAYLKVNAFPPRCPSGRTFVTPRFGRYSVTHHLGTTSAFFIKARTAPGFLLRLRGSSSVLFFHTCPSFTKLLTHGVGIQAAEKNSNFIGLKEKEEMCPWLQPLLPGLFMYSLQ